MGELKKTVINPETRLIPTRLRPLRLWPQQLRRHLGILRPIQHPVWKPRLCRPRAALQEEVRAEGGCLVHVSVLSFLESVVKYLHI